MHWSNTWLLSQPHQSGDFLLTHEWALFLATLGKAPHQVACVDKHNHITITQTPSSDDTVLAIATIYEDSYRGNLRFIYAPMGPRYAHSMHPTQQREVVEALISYAHSKFPRALFFKLEAKSFPQENAFMTHGFDGQFIQPERTSVIDLKNNDKELMAQMHQKTRYNIRLSYKHGIEVDVRSDAAATEAFLSLMRDTTTRDNFAGHPDQYYRSLMDYFRGVPSQSPCEHPLIHCLIARKNNQILASALILTWGTWATHLHGASSSSNRELMAPYALHWHSIQWLKTNGYEVYDLWGIDEARWPGVTRFKAGFGGKIITTHQTKDITAHPISYLFFSTIRRVYKAVRVRRQNH